jgi:hypothetical protein
MYIGFRLERTIEQDNNLIQTNYLLITILSTKQFNILQLILDIHTK